VNVLLDLHDTAKRIMADAGAIDTPILMLAAGRDWVVSLDAQRKFFDNLSSQTREFQLFPDAYHAIFHETNRAEIVGRMRDFIEARFADKATAPSLLDADKVGYTSREYERLKIGNGGGPMFAVARTTLRTVGRLSHGVKTGLRSGFDSGLSLDYVYRNEAAGSTPVGRFIDRSYLNSIGWRGIRQRKINLQNALQSVIGRTQHEGRPVRILDLAAGPGRYVIETIAGLTDVPVTAVLRDYKQENVDAARALAHESGLTGVTAERADAFDRTSTGAIRPRPTVGIVSGLYELFPANDMILKSLGGLADAIEPGGYLIYTNQPWHPQVEFIARVLRNREGEPWVMRRRTTAEIDQLVQSSGFQKLEMEIDQWGMFSVSIARRVAVC
jgi:SAM-dependent methyltransferase